MSVCPRWASASAAPRSRAAKFGSAAYTLADGDGSENAVTEVHEAYPVSVEGQAQAWVDVHRAVAALGPAGLGVFYWEPAWLPVGPPSERAANEVLWDRDGSGWMSRYAAEYDPKHAGFPHPGSSWDNQAWFDFEGHPHPTLAILGDPLGHQGRLLDDRAG